MILPSAMAPPLGEARICSNALLAGCLMQFSAYPGNSHFWQQTLATVVQGFAVAASIHIHILLAAARRSSCWTSFLFHICTHYTTVASQSIANNPAFSSITIKHPFTTYTPL